MTVVAVLVRHKASVRACCSGQTRAKFLSGTIIAVAISILIGTAFAGETVYYLGGLAQTSFPTLPNNPTYGQINLACRTGWRFIQPSPCSGATCTWDSIDQCEARLRTARARSGRYRSKSGRMCLYGCSRPPALPLHNQEKQDRAAEAAAAF
jgi:hypothetical protein